jgi:hypothetical protein
VHWLICAYLDYKPEGIQQLTPEQVERQGAINQGEFAFVKGKMPKDFRKIPYDSMPLEVRAYLESLRKKSGDNSASHSDKG